MSDVNDVTISGRLGADPELRHTQTGTAVTNFPVASNQVFVGKDGEKTTKTTWHRVVVWGKTAENVCEYLAKGRRVLVKGRIQNRSFDTAEGEKRFVTEVVANNVTFLDSKASQQTDSSPSVGQEEIPF